jgi:hypothetical protein
LEREDGRIVSKAGLLYFAHDVSKVPAKEKPKSQDERIAELEAKLAALLNVKAEDKK